MAQTTSKRSPAAKAAATPRPRATAGKATAGKSTAGKSTASKSNAGKSTAGRSTAGKSKSPIDRTAKLSEDVLDSVEAGQRAAIDAVRKFVDTVDQALPARGQGPTRRQEVVDSAMEMADRLVQMQYDFVRKVIDSAAQSMRHDGVK
jgi:hypothetical protein